MLASKMTMEVKRSEEALKVILSRFLIWLLISRRHKWKENWSGKESLSQFSKENSWLNGEKEGRNLLFLFINRLFRQSLCLEVRYLRDKLCGMCSVDPSRLRIDFIIWFGGWEKPHRWNLLYSFFRWRCIGMRPAIALIFIVGDVQKVSDIYSAALHCIFLRVLRG